MARPPTRAALAIRRSHGDIWRKRSTQSIGRTSLPSTSMRSLVTTCGGRNGASPTVTHRTTRTVQGKAVSARSANTGRTLRRQQGGKKSPPPQRRRLARESRSSFTRKPSRMAWACLQRGIDPSFGKARHIHRAGVPPVHDHAQAKLAGSSAPPTGNLVVPIKHAVGQIPGEPHEAVWTWSNEVCVQRLWHRAWVSRLR